MPVPSIQQARVGAYVRSQLVVVATPPVPQLLRFNEARADTAPQRTSSVEETKVITCKHTRTRKEIRAEIKSCSYMGEESKVPPQHRTSYHLNAFNWNISKEMTDNFEHEEIGMRSTLEFTSKIMAEEPKLHTTRHPYPNLIRLHVP